MESLSEVDTPHVEMIVTESEDEVEELYLHKDDTTPLCLPTALGSTTKTFTVVNHAELKPTSECFKSHPPKIMNDDFKQMQYILGLSPFNDGMNNKFKETIKRCKTISYSYDYFIDCRGKKNLKCIECDFVTAIKSELTRHIRSHKGDKPFQCEVCFSRFREKGHLKKHLKIHSKEKPFSCSNCSYKATQKSHLESHNKKHTKEKPYECDICRIRFGHKSNLTAHTKTHKQGKMYKCPECSFLSVQKYILKSHLMKYLHADSFICSHCDFRTKNESNLKQHLKNVHKLPCSNNSKIKHRKFVVSNENSNIQCEHKIFIQNSSNDKLDALDDDKNH